MRSRLQKPATVLPSQSAPLASGVYRLGTGGKPNWRSAQRTGLAWQNTFAVEPGMGSPFLGEIYVDAALPRSEPVQGEVAVCSARMEGGVQPRPSSPPTGWMRGGAFRTRPSNMPGLFLGFQAAMGNRIWNCQLKMPWNKFAQRSICRLDERAGLSIKPCSLFGGSGRDESLQRTEGSPIRRIGTNAATQHCRSAGQCCWLQPNAENSPTRGAEHLQWL